MSITTQMQAAVARKRIAGGDPTLIEQLDASTISGSDGDPITTWTATVGKDATNGGGSLRPALQTAEQNGLNVLRFDGSDDTMATAAFDSALTQPYVIFMVFKLNTASSTNRVLSDNAELSGTRMIMRIIEAFQYQLYAGSGFQNCWSATSPNTSWHIIYAEFNGASTKFRVDGGTEETIGASPGTAGLAALRISGDYDGTINPAAMDVGEILVYSGNSVDKSAKMTELNSKWAVY